MKRVRLVARLGACGLLVIQTACASRVDEAGTRHVSSGQVDIFIGHGWDAQGSALLPTNACILVEGFDLAGSRVVDALPHARIRLVGAGDSVPLRVVARGRYVPRVAVAPPLSSQALLQVERGLQPDSSYRLEVDGLPPALASIWRASTSHGRLGDQLALPTSAGADTSPPTWVARPVADTWEDCVEAPPWQFNEVDISPPVRDETGLLGVRVQIAGPTRRQDWLEPLYEGPQQMPSIAEDIMVAFGGGGPRGEKRVAHLTAIDAACNETPAPAPVAFKVP